MSDSNRGVLAALAGIAALLVATGAGAFYGSLYSPAKKQYAAVGASPGSGDTYNGVTKSLPDIALVPEPVERAIANPSPYSGEDHEKRDLAAQESMAAWAFYMTLLSGMTVIITGFGTYFIAAQVRLTREAVEDTEMATQAMFEANRIAERAAQISDEAIGAATNQSKAAIDATKAGERAYVKISRIELSPDGSVTFQISNVGRTPAKAAFLSYSAGWHDREGQAIEGRSLIGDLTMIVEDPIAAASIITVTRVCSMANAHDQTCGFITYGSIIYQDIFGDWFASGFRNTLRAVGEGPTVTFPSYLMPVYIPFRAPPGYDHHQKQEDQVLSKSWDDVARKA